MTDTAEKKTAEEKQFLAYIAQERRNLVLIGNTFGQVGMIKNKVVIENVLIAFDQLKERYVTSQATPSAAHMKGEYDEDDMIGFARWIADSEYEAQYVYEPYWVEHGQEDRLSTKQLLTKYRPI